MHIRFSIFILLFGLVINSFGQVGEARTKAVLLERFSRFITWPEDTVVKDSSDQFKILVFGDKKTNKALNNIYSDFKIKNKTVYLCFNDKNIDVEDFDMIYSTELSDSDFNLLLDKVRKLPILIVANKKRYAEKGAHININIIDGSIEFSLNKSRFKESNLKCSHLLYQQAKEVIDTSLINTL